MVLMEKGKPIFKISKPKDEKKIDNVIIGGDLDLTKILGEVWGRSAKQDPN
jgi:hypothetical protein